MTFIAIWSWLQEKGLDWLVDNAPWLVVTLFIVWGVVWVIRRMVVWATQTNSGKLFVWLFWSNWRSFKAFSDPQLIKAFLMWRRPDAVASSCIRVGCTLDDYKDLLKRLAAAAKVSLLWTNIYPPSEVMEGDTGHRSAFKEFTGHKMQISFVRKGETETWRNDAKLQDFEKTIPPGSNNASRYYYAWETVRNDMGGVIVGDYAIFDQCFMVSFNPTTEDRKLGDLFVTLGDVGAHAYVFTLAETKPNHHFKPILADLLN